IIAHVLDRVLPLADVTKVIVCPPDHVRATEELLEHRNLTSDFTCVVGGATRQESVYRGLLHFEGYDSVVIHEAVRPFVTTAEFRALIDESAENVIYGLPIPFTVLVGHEYVEQNLDRSSLVNVQLPQKFDAAKLRIAHELARQEDRFFTEDASLFHHYRQGPVRILAGSPNNIKITQPVDLVLGEAIYSEYVLGGASD
ncbi:MAG: 2-C-methyl-D-erythritol 4-phosphate cytidylyltransferase, partial [Coriobacteriia bacterium]|nr:2-C-methyl-D-erythritol 4-phosphate cytidylyltransferase [Coriobacteriia bacterium]